MKAWLIEAWSRLFLNPRKAKIGIAIFVACAVAAWSTTCRGAELWGEVGMSIVDAEAPVVGFAIEWPKAGPIDLDYMVGLHLLGAAEGMRNQSALTLGIVDGFGRFDIGLGLCFLHHTDELSGSRENFWLYVSWNFSDRSAKRVRHCSNAGQSPDNTGRNFATYAHRFGR